MATTKPWADGPFGLIPATHLGLKNGEKATGAGEMAGEMRLVHNALLRGINAIYLQCVNVQRSPEAVADFVSFASAWGEAIKMHHDEEEMYVFPSLEELLGAPGLMAANVEQHHAFHEGLETYAAYLKAVLEGKEEYDGERLKAIIGSFMPVLRQHLDDEIDTLLALKKYEDKADLSKWFKEIVTTMAGKANDNPLTRYDVFPLMFHSHDATYDDESAPNWPPVPWFVRLLFQWVFIPKHKSWWQFAPSTASGQPKELPFA